jgi:hypothetical protein
MHESCVLMTRDSVPTGDGDSRGECQQAHTAGITLSQPGDSLGVGVGAATHRAENTSIHKHTYLGVSQTGRCKFRRRDQPSETLSTAQTR